jgi:hypothetical protein
MTDPPPPIEEDAGYWRQKYEEQVTLNSGGLWTGADPRIITLRRERDEARARCNESDRYAEKLARHCASIRAETVSEIVASLRALVDHIEREFGGSP